MMWLPNIYRHGEGVTPFAKDFDALLNDFFSGWELGPARGKTRTWSPAINVEETDKELIVTADIPGIEAKDVEIVIENNVLTLKGERKDVVEEKKKNLHRVERTYGSFHRSLALPDNVDTENVTATGKNGVVTITLPKSEPSVGRRIDIEEV